MVTHRLGPMLAIGTALGSAFGALSGILAGYEAWWLFLATMVCGVLGAALFGAVAEAQSDDD